MTATTDNPAAPPSLHRLVRSTLVVMVGFLLTKSVSLLQTIIIANRFGAGAEYDTFVLGSTLPDYLVRLIGGGALGVAFIPVFSALLNANQQAAAWKLASQTFNTLLVAAAAICTIVMLTAPLLVQHIVAPGLNAADAQQTAEIMRILSAATIIFTVSGIISGVLHGHNHFFLPVLAPIFQDLGLLFGVIVFTGPFGVHGLAWGTLLGAVMHIGIQMPGLIKYQFRWLPVLGWRDPQLRHVIQLMLPRMLFGASFMINLIVISNINSRLGEGAASAFSWGLRLIDIPQALIGTATGVVVFPTLAALTSMGRIEERRKAFSGALRFIIVATIPASVGLLMVGYPVLRILFNEEESARIFTVMQVMSLAIFFQSLHEVLTRAFYAEQDTLRPLIISVIATLISIATAVGMYAIFRAVEPPLWSPLAVGGPALAYVVTFAVECVLLARLLKRRWGDIALPELSSTTARTLGATGVMLLALLGVDAALGAIGFGGYALGQIVVRVAAIIAAGGVVFPAAALYLFNLDEVRQLPRLLFHRQPVQ